MLILKLEIFQNSKSQKCKLWGRPPPLFGKSLHLNFFYDGFPYRSNKSHSLVGNCALTIFFFYLSSKGMIFIFYLPYFKLKLW